MANTTITGLPAATTPLAGTEVVPIVQGGVTKQVAVSNIGGSGSGTVTSIATGAGLAGGPITTSGTISLAATSVAPGSYTNTNLTVDAYGRITAASAGTSTVTSVFGTANEITSSGSSAITLSLPAALTFTGKTVTGGAYTGGTINGTTVGATTPATGAFTTLTTSTGQITTAPSSANDLVNKSYVDSIAAGLTFHTACNLATTAALPTVTYSNGSSGVGATLTASANGALSVDSVTPGVNDRILVKNQASALQNGVYTVTTVGDGSTPFVLTRATDMNTSGSGFNQINAGNYFLITTGTVNTNTSWVQTTALPITVGTTSLVFSQFSSGATAYTAGTGLSLLTNQFSISNTAVTAGSYGSGSQIPTFSVNARGQLTAAANTAIAIAGSQITSGTVAIVNGGTGANSQQGAMNALAGATTSGSFLRGNGTNVSMSTIQASDVPTLNQNTTGNAANVTGTVAIANGGTGQNSKANAFNALSPITSVGDLIIGTGTNTSSRLAIGTTSGYVLTTNGTTASWQAPSGGGVSSFQTSLSGLTPSSSSTGAITLAGTLGVASGGTGATTLTGIIKGSGTSAFTAATAGTDYQAPIALTTTGTSGAATFVGNTLNIPQYTSGGGSGTVTSVGLSAPSFLSVTGSPVTTSGTLALSYSGTALPVANGGTGQTTANAALNGLLPSQTSQSGKVLSTDGTNTSWISAGGTGTVTSVGMSVPAFLSVTGSPITASGTLAVSLSGTALPVANGGTGATTATAAFDALAPSQTGNSGKYLTTNGTTTSWATVSGTGTVTSVGQTFTGGLISVSGSPITTSGTLALTVAGTSGGIPYFSSGTTWATSAALAANSLMVGGGAGLAPATIATGTGVVTALSVNTGTAGAFVVNGGALGTPTSGTLTNCTFPTLNQNTSGTAAGLSATLAVASGGTGLTATPTNGQIDIGNGTGFTRTTLTAGSNITITNGAGSITIAASGGGTAGPIAESYQTISSNYSLTSGSNGFSVGPVSVATGVAVTVPTGQVWLIAA